MDSAFDPTALGRFRIRLPRARQDAEHALAFVVENARDRVTQQRCVNALVRKTEILWHILDCVEQQAGRELVQRSADAVA